MKVVPLEPDVPQIPRISPPRPDANAFEAAVNGVASALRKADAAEDAYSVQAGSLQDAVLERARADVALAIATAAAQRAAQAVQSILTLQI